MSDVRDNANYVIVLPTVDRIHEVLAAFLRTSEFGIWSLDESASNDSFVITCIRGEWKKSLLGLGSTLVPGSNARRTLAQIPMRLQVTIRRFRLHTTHEKGMKQWPPQPVHIVGSDLVTATN